MSNALRTYGLGALTIATLSVSARLDAAEVRVAHLSPDAPAVDVWVDGTAVLTDVAYPALSHYLELPAGPHSVQVFVAGTAVDPVIDAGLDLAADDALTVAATGLLADDSFGPVVVEDERSSSPAAAWVRFFHGSPDAPAVDVTLTDGTVVFGDVAFNEGTGYLALDPGQVDLQVRVAGTDTVVLSYGDIALEAGTTLSVWATGTLADGTLGAKVSVESPGDGGGLALLEAASAELRVAHLSPDAPAVDVWVDGGEVLSGVAYPALSGYLTLPAATRHVQVFVAGTQADPVIDAMLTPLPGQALTVAATGLLADGSFGPALIEDRRDADPEMATVRFVHTGADAPAVDVTLTDGTVLFGDVEFNEAADWLAVAPGTLDLQVRVAGTGTVVLGYGGVALEAQTVLTVWAAGLLADGSLSAWVSVEAPGDGAGLTPLEAAMASLRVAHLSSDAPAVDVRFNGDTVLEGVSYPAFSGYLEVPAATGHVQVFVAGTDENPVIDAMLTFDPASATTVAATGLLADGSFGPVVLHDDRSTLVDQARVRFVHAAADAPAVDIALPDGTVLFGDVEFNEAAGSLSVAPAAVPLQVRLAGTDTVVLSFDPVTLEASTAYTVWATGTLDAGTLGAWATIDAPGDGSQAAMLEISTAVTDGPLAPAVWQLGAAYPNPFNPTTAVPFVAPQAGEVRLSVFDVLGRRVATLLDGPVAAGEHRVVWDAGTSASGLYLVQLEAAGQRQTRPLTLVR